MVLPPYVETGIPPSGLWVLIVVATVFSAQWVRYIVCIAEPGLVRLLRALPVILVCQLATLLFRNDANEVLARTMALFLIGWLATFKVLALCIDRGPLKPTMTTAQMVVVLLMPIYPHEVSRDPSVKQGRLADKAAAPRHLFLKALVNAAVLAMVVVLEQQPLPPVVRHILLAFGLYSFIDIMMNGPASVVTYLVGLDVIPPFDKPFLSSSFADFWGRRWNVTTSSVLRVLVYDIIVDGHTSPGKRLTQARRAAGVLATFLTSGLIHEYILWMDQPTGRVSGKWLVFFTMQGPLLLMETHLQRWWTRHHLPHLNIWLARLLTLALLETCAYWFFFPPVDAETDTASRVMQGLAALGSSMFNLIAAPLATTQILLNGLVAPAKELLVGLQHRG